MKKALTILLFITAIVPNLFSQSTKTRYLEELFSGYDLVSNITYGTGSKNILDIYTGTGDTKVNRPLVLFIHGGGFKDGDKVSGFGTRVCGAFARRGYVVASINYRTTSTQNTDQQSFEAMIRALQDAKAAVRYFRKNSDQYGIDTTQIFATGSSAGCITALHMAFLDQSELPSYVVDATLKNLEGTSGNPGYSSRINGVISNWGAICDTAWMKNNKVPVYSVHGTADSTVYFNKIPADGPFAYSGKYVYAEAQRLKLPSGLRVFNNTGHTLDNSTVKQDSAISDFSKWLYTILKTSVTSVKSNSERIPVSLEMHQNYPNPFNPSTEIKFVLSKTGRVTLAVYNLLGEMVTLLADEMMYAGTHQKIFTASNLASGVYFYQLNAEEKVITRKMLLIK